MKLSFVLTSALLASVTLSACTHGLYASKEQAELGKRTHRSVRLHLAEKPPAPNSGRLFLINADSSVEDTIDSDSVDAAALTLQAFRSCADVSWTTAVFVHPASVGAPAEYRSCAQLRHLADLARNHAEMEAAVLSTMRLSLYLDKLHDAHAKLITRHGETLASNQEYFRERLAADRKMLSDLQELRDTIDRQHDDLLARLAKLKTQIEAIK